MSDEVQADDDQQAVEKPRDRDERLWEKTLPDWQQWLNTFCENWIFAFIVAMAIRSFFLEAYRIPTASMEPMLLGEPAFYKADHVVVDRISHFFTLPKRWEVTVFQYPRPEVMVNGAVQPAIDPVSGERTDNLFTRPLAHRNFVKRCVVLPGDVFYIAGGDLHLKQGDGWVTASKPDDVQEALWVAMYEHGAAEGYAPWQGALIDDAGLLRIAPQGAVQAYTQPLINLYIKDATYRVMRLTDAVRARRDFTMHDGMGSLVEVSMTRPLFIWQGGGGNTVEGNIWHLDRWEVSRLTTADLDSGKYGSTINPLMREKIGDVRIRFRPQSLSGAVALRLSEGQVQSFSLQLHDGGWRLSDGSSVLAEGGDAVVGADWALVHVDDRLWVERDGERLCEPITTIAVIPDQEPTSIAWLGSGQLLLEHCAVDRDVHYSSEGFLRDYRRGMLDTDYDTGGRRYKELAVMLPSLEEHSAGWQKVQERLGFYEYQSGQQKLVREQMLGHTLSEQEGRLPIGYSPETAITAPEGAYLLLGDNSPFSLDSRSWGWVPERNLRGKVLAVAFPRWKLVR